MHPTVKDRTLPLNAEKLDSGNGSLEIKVMQALLATELGSRNHFGSSDSRLTTVLAQFHLVQINLLQYVFLAVSFE